MAVVIVIIEGLKQQTAMINGREMKGELAQFTRSWGAHFHPLMLHQMTSSIWSSINRFVIDFVPKRSVITSVDPTLSLLHI
jgi:hypothetical protein